MNKLTRYLGSTLLLVMGMVTVLLVGLECVFALVQELRGESVDIGQAFYRVLLMTPRFVVSLFPLSALIGTLLGLGLLASHNELIAIQTAGWSIFKIAGVVMQVALLGGAMMWVVQEEVIPWTEKQASHLKSSEKAELSGGWFRTQEMFLHVGTIRRPTTLERVHCYYFDDAQRLLKTRFARLAQYEGDHWTLYDVKETRLGSEIVSTSYDRLIWEQSVPPFLFTEKPEKALEELPFKTLWHTIRYREDNGLDAGFVRLAFWQRGFRPCATVIMVLLAVSFAWGPLRSASMGLRWIVGVLVGVGFLLCQELFGPLALLYALPPFIGACLPCLLFLGVGVWLFYRHGAGGET